MDYALYIIVGLLSLLSVITVVITIIIKHKIEKSLTLFHKDIEDLSNNMGATPHLDTQPVSPTKKDFTALWAAYNEQQNNLIEEFGPNLEEAVLFYEKKRKRPQKGIRIQNDIVDNPHHASDDTANVWDVYKERQKNLLREFELVFKDAELYYKRIVEPLESISDDEKKDIHIWSKIERYKWTATGLAQVQDISLRLINCRTIAEYQEQSVLLARIIETYIRQIEE